MKKTGFLVVMSILALGALGIGYAAWSQIVTINGTVTSGTFNPTWVFESNDTGTANDPGLSQNVGATDLVVGTFTNASGTMSFTVTNAYPGYESDISVTLTNNGSVPIKLALGTPSFTGSDVNVLAALAGTTFITSYVEGAQILPGAHIDGVLHIVVDAGAGNNIAGNLSATGSVVLTVTQAVN